MFDILLMTGAAGAGKTSTAEAWAASRPGVAAHLSHDTIHQFVKAGIANPADGPDPEAERQWRLAIDVCVATCRVYAAAGVRCAVDTFLLPTTLVLWAGLRDLEVGVLVLSPDVETAVRRNAARLRATSWGVPEWQVRANHAAMGAWKERPDVLLLDTSTMDMPQILTAVDTWERSERRPSLRFSPTNAGDSNRSERRRSHAGTESLS